MRFRILPSHRKTLLLLLRACALRETFFYLFSFSLSLSVFFLNYLRVPPLPPSSSIGRQLSPEFVAASPQEIETETEKKNNIKAWERDRKFIVSKSAFNVLFWDLYHSSGILNTRQIRIRERKISNWVLRICQFSLSIAAAAAAAEGIVLQSAAVHRGQSARFFKNPIFTLVTSRHHKSLFSKERQVDLSAAAS